MISDSNYKIELYTIPYYSNIISLIKGSEICLLIIFYLNEIKNCINKKK